MSDGVHNLREFLKANDWTFARLSRVTGIGYQRLADAIAVTGNATLDEMQSISKAIACDIETVVSVLAETARRPGERDPRGRKKAETSGGNGNGRLRKAGNGQASPDVGSEGNEPEGLREALPAEDGTGCGEPVRKRGTPDDLAVSGANCSGGVHEAERKKSTSRSA